MLSTEGISMCNGWMSEEEEEEEEVLSLSLVGLVLVFGVV